MNHYKSESHGAMTTAEPLFASVWLALFYELRKTYSERRSVNSVAQESLSAQSSHSQKNK